MLICCNLPARTWFKTSISLNQHCHATHEDTTYVYRAICFSELHQRGLIIKFVADALRYLLEVHECLVLGIGGQLVGQSDEHTDRQGRCQAQHIEQYLVAGVQREWLNYASASFHLLPCARLSVDSRTDRIPPPRPAGHCRCFPSCFLLKYLLVSLTSVTGY